MRILSRYYFFLCLALLIIIASCSRGTDNNPPPPPPPSPPAPALNYALLHGWWDVVKITDPSGTQYVGGRWYFDSDNFHFQSFGQLGTRTGSWSTRPGDSMRLDLTAGWGAPTWGQFLIKKLVSDTLIFLYGTATAIYKKFDSLPITTPPISTIAGTGTNGFSGDGGLATAAKISDATFCIDAARNIYMLDAHRVRKITAATGIITTIAGTGVNGYSGDGGLAINAALGRGSISVDLSGNIYLSDIDNHCIRKINASDGKINRIAGTPSPYGGYTGDGGSAINALLNYPSSLKLDPAGNLVFVDLQNRRIRKIDLSTGIITTIAGNGVLGSGGDGGPAIQAELRMNSITVDDAGNIIIVESNSHKLRRILASTGVISTIAGNGMKGYNGEGVQALNTMFDGIISAAVDASGNVYTAEHGTNRIRKLSITDGKFYTVAGTGYGNYTGEGIHASAFAVYFPDCLNVDGQGKLYFMDRYNYRLRKIQTN